MLEQTVGRSTVETNCHRLPLMAPMLITGHKVSFGGLVSSTLFSKSQLKELIRQMLLGNTDALQEDAILNTVQSAYPAYSPKETAYLAPGGWHD